MGLETLWEPPFVQPKPGDHVSWTFWCYIWFLGVWLEDEGSSWGDAGRLCLRWTHNCSHWHTEKADFSKITWMERGEGRSTTLCSLCWYCVLLQGKVAPSQSRAAHRCVQHISNRSQTTDVSQVEITCKASGGTCQGWSGLQHYPEVAHTYHGYL